MEPKRVQRRPNGAQRTPKVSQRDPRRLPKVPKRDPKRLPNELQAEPMGPKRPAQDPQKATRKRDKKITPKRHSKKTCLSKGTGSALKRRALQKRVLNILRTGK